MTRKKTYVGKKMKYHKKKYQAALQKRREELGEARKKLKEKKKNNEELLYVKALYDEECKKRKRAEHVANDYYYEWKAERQAKDRALANQVYKPSCLPDSFYLKDDLLNFQYNEREEIVGAGVFGTMKLCQYKGNIEAVKCFKRTDETLSAAKRSVLHEAKVLLNLKCHESIPTLLGVCLEGEPLKIIMQFYGIEMQSISLHSLCKEKHHNVILSEDQWNNVINDIAKAIDHVHSCGYLHNDIKTDNVVLYKSDDTFKPVVIDFGKSCRRDEGSTKRMSTPEQIEYRKRYKHIAPEVVDGSYKQSIYSDIYSFGYLVYNIYTLLCENSAKLRSIVKQCYRVKTWSCRASFSKVSHLFGKIVYFSILIFLT